ncbi:LacI family DNA-binding transcriptional regulator [Prosthecomicrobium pneumaticum]|uniref:LacI family gluconate utilization system Gnt-I transcriptional repressor n=1 Tax=Prosthecomicrobium pneumaticum TaxID=81895 RepID=A0A7W9FIY9_9HYPH|nr:LacI family DNA-binding transcriptional regulator [Prosthecomicrobium pneumaticum]MBB5750985.1 LacI family gluconate utilization system Gnt-I transcriptional repressor [Prosthecomicrobium pneumaticum]
MADVARAAGVSSMTVSRALRRDAAVNEETRAAILDAAERLGYVFDATAASLRARRTDFIAATIPSINNANFADTVRGLTDGLAARGYQVLLGYTNYDMAEEERLVEQLLRRRPEAIVVTGGRHTARTRTLLAKAGIPVVETWDLPDEPIGSVVGFSNADAVEAMVDRFVAAGFRRIAFLGGDAARDTRGTDRRRGFLRAMAKHGLDAARLIAGGTPPISMREGAAAMAALLDRLPDTELVICVSDLAAFGALTECQRRGLAVPETIAIAGFGDYDIAGISVPTLTTIDPFPREIGRRAAELILGLLDGTVTGPRIVAIMPQLRPGGSALLPDADGAGRANAETAQKSPSAP